MSGGATPERFQRLLAALETDSFRVACATHVQHPDTAWAVVLQVQLELLADDLWGPQAQRDLTNAESNELLVRPVELRSVVLIGEVLKMYLSFARSHEVNVLADPAVQDIVFTSDKVLLRRVLGNLVKNAVEVN